MPRSVLIHLLPGLALFAHRHCRAPEPVVQVWQYLWGPPPASAAADAPLSFFWISGAPLLFYAAWQLMYFVIVQVVPQDLVRHSELLLHCGVCLACMLLTF